MTDEELEKSIDALLTARAPYDQNAWLITDRLVWSHHGYFDSTASRQNTNHGSTKLAWCAAEAHQKGLIRYKYCTWVH